MKRTLFAPLLILGLVVAAPTAQVGIERIDLDVNARIRAEGMDNSRAYAIGQALLDSLGPRLTGTPAVDRANDWAVSILEGWGVDARTEPYGMWKGWERGVTHVDLVAPRIRTLDASSRAMGTEISSAR